MDWTECLIQGADLVEIIAVENGSLLLLRVFQARDKGSVGKK